MSKITQGELLEARTYTPYAKWSFYRPHPRFTATGEITNHATGEITSPPSRTKQDFKDQCDINNIIKSFKLTGQITHLNQQAAMGRFENLPDEIDFQTSMNTIRTAGLAFEALPAKLRDRFGNDPAAFLSFVADPENKDEATRLGIFNKPAEPATAAGGAPPPPPPPPPAAAASAEPAK